MNVENNEGVTALMGAAVVGQAEVVKILLAQGADADAKDKNGSTVLMLSPYCGQKERS